MAGAHLRVIMPARNTTSFEGMSQRWQDCVPFDRADVCTTTYRYGGERVAALQTDRYSSYTHLASLLHSLYFCTSRTHRCEYASASKANDA